MIDINILAVIVATIGAFVLSSVWYAVLSGQLSKLSKAYAQDTKMPAWKIAVELLRSFIVATVIALVFNKMEVTEIGNSLLYGAAFWLAFPFVLLVGSVMHEKVPMKLAAIHAGDWLIKLLFMAVLIGLWR